MPRKAQVINQSPLNFNALRNAVSLQGPEHDQKLREEDQTPDSIIHPVP
jgi:hypothetical protein